MKRIILFIFLSLFTFHLLLAKGDSINPNWYSKALENIKKQEYQITYSENLNAFQAPNRNNNLRFVYKNNGFIVSQRITETYKINEYNHSAENEKIKISDDWNAEFTVLGYGRNGKIEKAFVGKDFIAKNNTAYIKDQSMKIDYINNEDGMRQDFTIFNKPLLNKGLLTISLEIKTKENLLVGADALVIKNDDYQVFMKYNSLKIWDADGKILRGWFEEVENNVNNPLKKIKIVVNDKEAKYPIIIDPLSTNEDWSIEGSQLTAEFSFSVTTAGDVNGDGFSDVMISAPYFDDKGKVFVYYGSATGPSTSPDWEMLGSQQDGLFGYSISTAGDIDANGYSDIIVGIPHYGSSIVNEGRVIIYYGFSGGLSYDEGTIVSGGTQDIQLGFSVSTAGDFNGDGFSDVAFGAPFFTLGQSEEGKLFVYYGSPNGLELSTFWSTEGNVANMQLGTNLSTAGDFNGDGYSDIIVGNPNYLVYDGIYPLSGAGMFAIYFGSGTGISSYIFKKGNEVSGHFGKSVFTAGDVNGDGYSDVIVGKNSTIDAVYRGITEVYHGYDFDNDNIASFELVQAPDWSADLSSSIIVDGFGDAVSTAGDVNGDGYADVVIGAKSFNVDGDFVGGAFLYYGSLNGLESNYSWMAEGTQNNGLYGKSVGIAGDVNGDGYSDVIIGEYGYDDIGSGVNYDGKVYLYKGSENGLEIAEVWTGLGGEEFEYGISVSTAGDINGDGYSDILIGAPGYNGTTIHGGAYLYYGNERSSLESRIRQNNPSAGDILAAGNLTESNGSVELGLRVKSPFGRADGRMVYEFRKHGEIFSQGITYSNSVMFDGISTFQDLLKNPKGKPILATANGLQSSYSDSYQWRVRKEFSLVNNPYQKYGPWKYYSAFSPIQPYAFRPRIFIPLNIVAQIKVLLEGPFDEIDNMTNFLNTSIPLVSPYPEDPITASAIPGNAVDWILVELRDKNDNTKVLGSRSAFLFQDKTIRELDGSSPLSFTLPADDYYIVVKHRNHLPIMSVNPVSLTAN